MRDYLSEQLTRTRIETGHRAVDECLILRYRRVALLVHDPLGLAIQPCNFERQMEYLATSFNVISLDDLKQHLETATPFKSSAVAVTFAGGYSDVLYTAKEVLERFEIPATVFLPSASLTEGTPFWWDVLEDLLVASNGVRAAARTSRGPRAGAPDRLAIEIDNQVHCWPLTSVHERFKAFEDLYAILPDSIPSEQRAIITKIATSLEGAGGELNHHATLDMQEVRSLEQGGLITVGGHTHNWVKLSLLSEADQASEIRRNRQILEEILGHEIKYFAYPFGDQDGPTPATTEMLKGLGFALSCHVAPDMVSVTGAVASPAQRFASGGPTSPYELPRLTIGDWNPFTFHRRLRAFFG